VPHFHELASDFVKDSMEHVGGELLLCCVAVKKYARRYLHLMFYPRGWSI
jgi:hypothetical protein